MTKWKTASLTWSSKSKSFGPNSFAFLAVSPCKALLNTTHSMAKMRGKWHRYRGIRTIVTYHPAYLLRNPAAKKDTWEDLQMLMKEMGLVRPSKQ